MRALFLLTALAAGTALAADPPYEGEGAQRLAMAATRIAKKQGPAGLCLAGVDVHVNAKDPVSAPVDGSATMIYNAFIYYYLKPGHRHPTYSTSMREWVTGFHGTKDYVSIGIWDDLTDKYLGKLGQHDLEGPCLADMTVDSGKALALAVRYGLRSGAFSEKYLSLRTNVDEDSYYYRDKKLAGRTFWIVRNYESPMEYFIDAGSGELLLKKKP